jgi:hypothetical protein
MASLMASMFLRGARSAAGVGGGALFVISFSSLPEEPPFT